MSEIKTVRNRSGGGAVRSSISPSKEFASPLRSRFHVTEALLGKELLFTKKGLRRGTSRGTAGSAIWVSLRPTEAERRTDSRIRARFVYRRHSRASREFYATAAR